MQALLDDPVAGPTLVILVGVVATYVWRGGGLLLSGRLNPDGALIRWVGYVSFAMLAGLFSRMIVLPIGPLAEVSLAVRLAALAAAAAVFAATRRNLLFGSLAGVATLMVLVRTGLLDP